MQKQKLIVTFVKRPKVFLKKWLFPDVEKQSQSVQDIGLFLSGIVYIIIVSIVEYIFNTNLWREVLVLYGLFLFTLRCLFYFKNKSKSECLAAIRFCFDNDQKSIDRKKKAKFLFAEVKFYEVLHVARVTLSKKNH